MTPLARRGTGSDISGGTGPPERGNAMFERVKRLGLRVLNKIFLRSTIHQTHVELRELRERVDRLAPLLERADNAVRTMDLRLDALIDTVETQNEALADRIVGSAIDIRRALADLGEALRAGRSEPPDHPPGPPDRPAAAEDGEAAREPARPAP